LKKLEINRIDFFIEDRAVIYQGLKKTYNEQQIKNFAFLNERFGNNNEYKIMVSKNYPNSKTLLEKLNKGLSIIKKNGEYQKILEKYGMK